MVKFACADEIKRAHLYCAPISRAKLEKFFERRFIPELADDTATVTFIKFEGKTYAVTAAHVIKEFAKQADAEKIEHENYFLPSGKGVLIQPLFISAAAEWPDKAPDIALRQIDDGLPARIGKEAFNLVSEGMPTFPIPYAVAVGFPTLEKNVLQGIDGQRLAMPCVYATAEGVGSTENADQVQFYSEIENEVVVSSLSGMSGGTVLWSDGERIGLIGFVKQALDVNPRESENTIHVGPRVNFICQRARYDSFGRWVEHADREMPKRREALNEWARSRETADKPPSIKS